MEHDHVCIITSDAEKLMAWYKEKLGFEFIHSWTVDAMPGLQLYYIGRDSFKIEFFDCVGDHRETGANSLANIAAGYNHFAISVENIAATIEELEKKGVQIAAPVMEVPQAGIKASMVTDGDGNLIELIEKIA